MLWGEICWGQEEEEAARQNLRGSTLLSPWKWHLFPDNVHYVF